MTRLGPPLQKLYSRINLQVMAGTGFFVIHQLFSNECFTSDIGDRQIECSQNFTTTKPSYKPLGILDATVARCAEDPLVFSVTYFRFFHSHFHSLSVGMILFSHGVVC